MPYLSGPKLCNISTSFGLPVNYEWNGGSLSRWQYLNNLIEYCINNNRFSDLLSYLFNKNQFSEMLVGHCAADVDKELGQGIGYSKIAATSAGCACVKPAVTDGVSLNVPQGITSLGRAAKDGWPEVRKGAWTALESKTKGFVINRIPTSEKVEAIANPQQGMLVYDEEAKCLKIYVLKNAQDASKGGFWKCLSNTACPDSFVNN